MCILFVVLFLVSLAQAILAIRLFPLLVISIIKLPVFLVSSYYVNTKVISRQSRTARPFLQEYAVESIKTVYIVGPYIPSFNCQSVSVFMLVSPITLYRGVVKDNMIILCAGFSLFVDRLFVNCMPGRSAYYTVEAHSVTTSVCCCHRIWHGLSQSPLCNRRWPNVSLLTDIVGEPNIQTALGKRLMFIVFSVLGICSYCAHLSLGMCWGGYRLRFYLHISE